MITSSSLCSFIPIAVNDLDPTYFWFRDVTLFHPILKTIVRSVTIGLLCIHTSLMNFGSVIVFSYLVTMIGRIISSITAVGNVTSTSSLQRTKKETALEKCLTLHHELQIVLTEMSQVFYYYLPIGLGLACAHVVEMSFMAINLGSILPVIVTITCALIAVMLVAMVVFLFPIGVHVTSKSEKYIQFWNAEICSRYWRRKLRSCQSLKICIGGFCHINKRARRTLLYAMVDNTISLLLST